MKPPALNRLRKEDMLDSPSWFDKVIGLWNDFVEPMTQVLTNNVTFVDNFDGQQYEDDIDQAAIDAGYSIKVTMKAIPKGVLLLQIYKSSETHTPFTTAPYVDWSYAEGFITINSITGIDSNVKYRVRLQIV